MVERIQIVIQKLCKEIPQVSMVVESTLEEHVSKIIEVIQGFCTRIRELEVRTTSRKPHEEKEQRERTSITSVTRIKTLDKECTKLYEEITELWKKLMKYLTMKVVEERLRNAQEKVQKATENINTLPPSEPIVTILANKQSYNEREQLRGEQKTLMQ
jgi:hypothetical protein